MATRLCNFCYLEKSGIYWHSEKKQKDGFYVSDVSDLSIGLMIASGMIDMGEEIGVNFIGPEYDVSFDDGEGTLRSGIIKERRSDTDLVLMHNDVEGTLVVIWRGTESLADLRTDLRTVSSLWPYSPRDAKLYVSSGVKRAHESVITVVTSTLKRLWETGKYSRIVVAGHSLGGALAHLHAHALSYLMEDELAASPLPREDNLLCYTIGANKAGNADFLEDYSRRVPHTYRLVNKEDIVPRIPIPRRNHVGVPVLMDNHHLYLNPSRQTKDRFVTEVTSLVGNTIKDHNAPKYLSILIGYGIKQRLSREECQAVDAAWTAFVQAKRVPKTVLVIEKDSDGSNDPMSLIARCITQSEPLQTTMHQTLLKAFGPDKACPEALENIMLYARKCTETHVFKPGSYDEADVTVHNFRQAVWCLIADPDPERRATELDKARLRLAFDWCDSDGDGLITPWEFSQFVTIVYAEDAKTIAMVQEVGSERIIQESLKELYEHYRLKFADDMAPTALSFREFMVWTKMKNVSSSEIVQKTQEQIAQVTDKLKHFSSQ